ncbi:hemerythrin domain-containing protein [Blastococcus deserti]|uniref:Hemerythrin domain-containing protein n=1 Tax=Blastococcus deserti TaxID=2259033 RepID=A0ABW4X7M5_9ACTN
MTRTLVARTDGRGQLLLEGQAAAPDGPVDLTIMWAMHRGFRRDLENFVRAAAATPVEDRATWRRLYARWGLFSTILHHHHTGEDAGLWPLLLARVDAAGDAAGRATLEAMAAEHAGIDPLLAACSVGFARLAGTADEAARSALAADLAAARDHLGRHLQHEERDAMAILQEHLQHADWERIGEEFFEPAYSRGDLLTLAAWVLHGLPPDALARMREQHHGRVLVAVWKLVLRRPFERAERRAFRYA